MNSQEKEPSRAQRTRERATPGEDSPPTDEFVEVAEYVVGVLQRGIDSIPGDQPMRAPSRAGVLRVLREYRPEGVVARAAAVDARATAQAQGRAPNIEALYAQRLAQHLTQARDAAGAAA